MKLEEFKHMLKADIITAMKSENKLEVMTLRSISNAITNAEIAERGKDLNYIDILSTLAKQRKQSIDAYKEAGKTDLANTEALELNIIEKYLPKSMSESELTDALNEMIGEQELTKKDMGRIVGEFRTKYPGQDMKFVSGLIMKTLN